MQGEPIDRSENSLSNSLCFSGYGDLKSHQSSQQSCGQFDFESKYLCEHRGITQNERWGRKTRQQR